VDAAGRPVLKFGKLLAGRSSQLLVNVRNNGLLPASARIEMDDHSAFALLEGPQVSSTRVCGGTRSQQCRHPL
jgi:hydrocephalus-inducing protein